jgi:hypothetical protein
MDLYEIITGMGLEYDRQTQSKVADMLRRYRVRRIRRGRYEPISAKAFIDNYTQGLHDKRKLKSPYRENKKPPAKR